MIYTGEASDPTVDDSGDAPPNWNYELIQHYVRDLTGNELAVYNDTTVTFWNVYGLDNVGKINYSDNSWNYYLKDHLGSPRVVIDQNRDIISAEDLDMWGYRMADRSFQSDTTFYKYTGKERDVTTGYDYFGARYYDSRIGRWGGADPMTHLALGWSPYRAFFCNPLSFTDPTGLYEIADDYELDKDGNISMVRETDDPTDKLIALDHEGNVTDKFIEVEKGILSNIKSGETGSGSKYKFMEIKGDDKAIKLFEFLAQNTIVEWGQVKYSRNLNYISTSNSPRKESGGPNLIFKLTTRKIRVREDIHSHPSGTSMPSGFIPGQSDDGDLIWSEWIRDYNPGVKLFIYNPIKNIYIRYNYKGVIE